MSRDQRRPSRTGEGDIEEGPLLHFDFALYGGIVRIRQAKRKRDDVLVDAGSDDAVEFQSLYAVHRRKALIHLELLHRMLRENEAMIPFFLDEVSMLDARNLSEIVEHARQLNFVPVVASPEPSDCVDTLYFLRSSEGNVRLEPATSRVRLVHEARDNLSDEWPVQAVSGQVNGDE